jgi:hypothetical protein
MVTAIKLLTTGGFVSVEKAHSIGLMGCFAFVAISVNIDKSIRCIDIE